MNPLTFGTVFRDATPYLPRWREQLHDLQESWGAPIHVIAVEGDSYDGTYDALKAHPPQVARFTLLHVEHGGPKFPSIDNPQRWKQLALVGNAVLARASLEDADFCYIESDLVWGKDTVTALVRSLFNYPAMAPMSFDLKDPTRFYDTWGHRKSGTSFASYAPYHPEVGTAVTAIDSAGSAFVARAQYVPSLAFSPFTCIRGIGDSLRAAGADLYLDPQLAVYHP